MSVASADCAAVTRAAKHGKDLKVFGRTRRKGIPYLILILPDHIGRKNWFFAGSDEGAKRAAVIYSLIATCKLCHLDPFAYLRDVLDRVSTHPASRIADLTPLGWQS